jgi:hexosaminidase
VKKFFSYIYTCIMQIYKNRIITCVNVNAIIFNIMKNLPAVISIKAASLAVLLFVNNSCSTQSEKERIPANYLKVTWELIDNIPGGNSSCNAAFTFINTGNSRIEGNGWALYFNQNTLLPKAMTDSASGLVEHINGDFYRFVPGRSFTLAPNDTLLFTYSYYGNMIKEYDAPNGMYIAFDEKKKSQSPWILKNNSVKPFTDYEKIFPGFTNIVPSPENEYIKNSALIDLSPSKISPIIPTPHQFIRGDGFAELNESMKFYYEKGLENEAEYLVTSALGLFGAIIRKEEGNSAVPGSVFLRLSDVNVGGVTKEAYHLTITNSSGITIEGSDHAGVFYGIQSLLALIPVSSFKEEVKSITIPCAEITDAPRFPFRGFLLDVARNFQKKEAVLKLIDLLALYKINTLNLRLTEDEGWRIQIAGLPELTQVGGRRGHTLNSENFLPPSFGSGPYPDSSYNHGTGFYTREDFKEIISYAGKRHIKVVPEICFPSHARAAIKSMEARYLYYTDKGDREKAEEFRLIDPADSSSYLSAQLYKDNIVCVALESTYHFYETVIADLVAMYNEAGYPLSFFHTGGDEVPGGAWKGSPECKKLLEANPEIKDSRQLQAFFFRRVLEILKKYSLGAGGWEEVVLNKDAYGRVGVNQEFAGRNVTPYVWDNTDSNIDLGYRIANAGYPLVLCNVTNLYFDLAYNADPKEPGLYWGGFQDARDPFVLIPYDVFKSAVYDDFGNITNENEDYSSKEHLKPENRKNILGLQAQLWSETVKGQAMMEYYVIPKLFAFAERAWADAPEWEEVADLRKRTSMIDSDWNEFANRIAKNELPRLDYLYGGFSYRLPLPGAEIEDGVLKANTPYPGLAIRLTTDGSEPNDRSVLYTGPMKVSGPVKLRSFSSSGRGGRSVDVK